MSDNLPKMCEMVEVEYVLEFLILERVLLGIKVFSGWEEALALQWDTNRLVLFLFLL